MCDAASHEGLLERVNRMHESQFGADKLIKTAGFALGFAASLLDLDHRYGPSDTVTKGLRQLAAKFADVRYALRFHGGYSGLLIELENVSMRRHLFLLRFRLHSEYYLPVNQEA
eukprot:m.234273 g.234273  ORF g.234273 m.234273 type:complete len:114 (+) comp19315_c0_seq3:276-617(+)